MLQTAYWALGIGITIIGVGLTLLYQGEALKKSKQTQDIGKKSYGAGIAWVVLGSFTLLLGFAIWALVQCGFI